jgi:hypothetical protein
MLQILQPVVAMVVLGEAVVKAGVVVTSAVAMVARSIPQVLVMTSNTNCVARKTMWSRSVSRGLIAPSQVKKR